MIILLGRNAHYGYQKRPLNRQKKNKSPPPIFPNDLNNKAGYGFDGPQPSHRIHLSTKIERKDALTCTEDLNSNILVQNSKPV
jgi:hypothetical protein